MTQRWGYVQLFIHHANAADKAGRLKCHASPRMGHAQTARQCRGRGMLPQDDAAVQGMIHLRTRLPMGYDHLSYHDSAVHGACAICAYVTTMCHDNCRGRGMFIHCVYVMQDDAEEGHVYIVVTSRWCREDAEIAWYTLCIRQDDAAKMPRWHGSIHCVYVKIMPRRCRNGMVYIVYTSRWCREDAEMAMTWYTLCIRPDEAEEGHVYTLCLRHNDAFKGRVYIYVRMMLWKKEY